MKTETIRYNEDGYDVTITVSQATVLMGMKRTRLQIEGNEADEQDENRRLLRILTYSDLMAATIEAEGLPSWPLDFEDFLTLPEKMVIEWERAVYDLNDHWRARPADEEGDKKKASPSIED